MKKFFFAAFPLAAVAVMALSHNVEPLPIGATIPNPDVKMKNIDGKEVSFKEANNKNGLLVMFSCNTCPVVKQYQSRSNEVCKYAMGKEIGVVLLNSNEAYRDNGDSYNDMIQYAKDNSYTWKYVVDNNSSMADAFGANRTPECFLFDKDLKLIYHGAIDDNSNGADEVTRKHLMVAIDEMLSGKEVSMKETRSVGCTIKRRS
ncbi:MAG TPA: thioredoxin family protein [Chitinophagaceae bacterium]|nr:thioredoxin family protein [Chitinophagaceae bacterium]